MVECKRNEHVNGVHETQMLLIIGSSLQAVEVTDLRLVANGLQKENFKS